jgi:hypothetical protein
MNQVKPFFKKFKVQVATIGIVIEVILAVISAFVSPEITATIKSLMIGIVTIISVVIGGHTVTDVATQLKSGEDKGKELANVVSSTIEDGKKLTSKK